MSKLEIENLKGLIILLSQTRCFCRLADNTNSCYLLSLPSLAVVKPQHNTDLMSRQDQDPQLSVREEFLSTCCDNNLTAVAQWLSQGADVNWRDEDGMSGLHWAAVNNYGDLLSLLLGQTKAEWSTVVVRDSHKAS